MKEISKLLQDPRIETLKHHFSDIIDCFYLVGGAVRDTILNREVQDIDFATSYTPDELIEICKKKGIKHIPTGIKYGTITIIIKGVSYEITSLRKDIKTDGRHAEVLYTKDLSSDSERRDFTINALYLGFNGNLYDFHNGVEDIGKRIIKFIGDSKKRIDEDYLRILRFFRFYSELDNFSLDKGSVSSAIAAKESLSKLSSERIRQELVRILTGKNYFNAIKLLVKHKICDSFINLSEQLVNKIENYQINNSSAPPYEILMAFSILENSCPKENLLKLQNTLKLSNKEIRTLNIIISHANNLPKLLLTTMEIKKLLFLNGRENLLALYYYQIFISAASTSSYNSVISQINQLTTPTFPVTGNDLIERGYQKGKRLGEMLNKMQQTWLDSNFSISKEGLLIEYNV